MLAGTIEVFVFYIRFKTLDYRFQTTEYKLL